MTTVPPSRETAKPKHRQVSLKNFFTTSGGPQQPSQDNKAPTPVATVSAATLDAVDDECVPIRGASRQKRRRRSLSYAVLSDDDDEEHREDRRALKFAAVAPEQSPTVVAGRQEPIAHLDESHTAVNSTPQAQFKRLRVSSEIRALSDNLRDTASFSGSGVAESLRALTCGEEDHSIRSPRDSSESAVESGRQAVTSSSCGGYSSSDDENTVLARRSVTSVDDWVAQLGIRAEDRLQKLLYAPDERVDALDHDCDEDTTVTTATGLCTSDEGDDPSSYLATEDRVPSDALDPAGRSSPQRPEASALEQFVINAEPQETDSAQEGTKESRLSEETSCDIDGFDWGTWLLHLPISLASAYFREYAEVVHSTDGMSLKGSSRTFPSWLMPANVRDAQGNRPDSPSYDVTTLWVPQPGSSVAKAEPRHMTPAMEQYWEVKAQHFDKVVLFKLGKFYEMLYVDAFIAQRVCKLRWMVGDQRPHVGFPEVALSRNARNLVESGFKAVVVEQMETPKELEKRNRSNAAGARRSKAVRRDVCEIFSAGAVTQLEWLQAEARFILAIAASSPYLHKVTEIGYAFCDVTTARICYGNWSSCNTLRTRSLTDKTSSALPSLSQLESHLVSPDCLGSGADPCQAISALLDQINPVEVVLDFSGLPEAILRLIKSMPNPPSINNLVESKFHHAGAFHDEFASLLGTGYTESSELSQSEAPFSSGQREKTAIQNALQEFLRFCSEHPKTAEAAVMLGRYLDEILLKQKVLSFARMERYGIFGEDPAMDNNAASETSDSAVTQRAVLEASVLRHLNVLLGPDSTCQGSLYEYVNHTVTAPGARLLRRWVVAPLYAINKLESRLDVVEWFLREPAALAWFRNGLKELPDFERLLMRVCTRSLQTLRGAIYFGDIHSKHFAEFVSLLKAVKKIHHLLESLTTAQASKATVVPQRLHELCGTQTFSVSGSLADCCLPTTTTTAMPTTDSDFETEDQGVSSPGVVGHLQCSAFQPLLQSIHQVENSLTFNSATNRWMLKEGVDSEFDATWSCVKKAEGALDQYLEERIDSCRSSLKAASQSTGSGWEAIKYLHVKHPYVIEVPVNHAFLHYLRKNEEPLYVSSSRGGYVRLRTSSTIQLAEELAEREQALNDCLYGCRHRLVRRFYLRHYDTLLAIAQAASELDILAGFATLSAPGAVTSTPATQRMCRPTFVKPTAEKLPILRLLDSRHPIVASALASQGLPYVPNDIRFNDDSGDFPELRFLLLTGSNMGGKSTLARQICFSIILAQIGCFVPASECVLTPADRIFTRLGAYDAILEGKSTFRVECEETAVALQRASSQSLVLLDELGRGTSTTDGSAIALATAGYIAKELKCRCLFITHYHHLAQELQGTQGVANMHMASAFLNQVQDKSASDSRDARALTFLYKLTVGWCPDSHGIDVARLAGVDPKIVDVAKQVSKRFQASVDYIRQHHARLRRFIRELQAAIEAGPDRPGWQVLFLQAQNLGLGLRSA